MGLFTNTNGVVPVAVPTGNPFLNNSPTALNQSSAQSLTTQQVLAAVNAYSLLVQNIISNYKSNGLELTFYQDILNIQATAIALQDVAQSGIQSSLPQIINYTLAVDMSLREVAFANGLTPDDFPSLQQLNPDIDSVNNVSAGTILKVQLVA
jgi:hypothetical protein